MQHDEFIEHLQREGEALAAVRLVDVDVPTCPEWSLPELIHHVGSVHRWQASHLRSTDVNTMARFTPGDRLPIDQLTEWFRVGLNDLLDVLDNTDPSALKPTWFGPRPATFWARRAANETAVHRWDAEAAVASPSPLDPAQAIDVIDELLEVLAPRRFKADQWNGPAVSIHLHATDTDGEWLITLGPDGLGSTREHAKGDVAARGTASDLALMIAGRIPGARLELFGEASALDRWFQTVKL